MTKPLGLAAVILLFALHADAAPPPGGGKPKPTATPAATLTPTATLAPSPTPTLAPTATPTRTAVPGLGITIRKPAAGADVPAAANVSGTYTSPTGHVGITVNDLPTLAGPDPSGTPRFIALEVPVPAGAAEVTATLAALGGGSVSDGLAVNGTGAEPALRLLPDVVLGPPPLTVTFSYEFSGTESVQTLRIDYDGDGTAEFVGAPPPSLQHTYATPALYQPILEIEDALGAVFEADTGVLVEDPAAIPDPFVQIWNGMKDRLRALDRDGALEYVTYARREDYAAVFAELTDAELQAIESLLPDIERVFVSPSLAEYESRVTIDGEIEAAPVIFVRDVDAVWRIRAF